MKSKSYANWLSMKIFAIFCMFIFSFNSFAKVIFDYKPYMPIDCKKRNSGMVNQLIPILVTENENELKMILITSVGKCESGRYIKYPRSSMDMYDTSIIAGRMFSPFKKYPAQGYVSPVRSSQTDLKITLKFNKRRLFRKYQYMDFDFDFIYYPDFLGQERVFRWYIEFEKTEGHTKIKLRYL